MKMMILSALLLSSVGLNIYLLNSSVVLEDNLEEDLIHPIDEVKLAQSAIEKIGNSRNSHNKNLRDIEDKFLPEASPEFKDESREDIISEDEQQRIHQNYSNERAEWQSDASNFFFDELELTESKTEYVMSLFNEREKAISDYFQEVTKGETGVYHHRPEDTVALRRINKKYYNLLRDTLGDEGFDRYTNFRDDYNAQKVNSGQEVHYIIEF